jgi:hypothetical protein
LNTRLKLKLVGLLIIMLFIIGCGTKTSPTSPNGSWTPLNPPEKIIIYRDGKALEVNKESKDFATIFNLSLKRFIRTLDLAQLQTLQGWESQLKKEQMGLEFQYSNEQTFGYTAKGVQPFSYDRLFFPLGTRDQTLLFYANGKEEAHGPHGMLQNSSELVDLITNMN